MESTIKIDYERGIQKPVIKIITPSELNEDSDVRDKLVHDFLKPVGLSDRNVLFTISSYFNLNSPFRLTTIEPLSYIDVLDRLKWEMVLRVMNINNASECRERYDDIKRAKPGDEIFKAPVPVNYDNYLKIVQFFDWVSEQPYVARQLD